MVLDIAGDAAKVENDVDVGKVGGDNGCHGSFRNPLVKACSRDRKTYKSVGGIEH